MKFLIVKLDTSPFTFFLKLLIFPPSELSPDFSMMSWSCQLGFAEPGEVKNSHPNNKQPPTATNNSKFNDFHQFLSS
jgi:hypothetical protein